MTKTLTKHGNSLALIIDKPILDLLKIDAETPLEITTDGKRLMIAPVDPQRRRKFEAALKDTMEKYDGMLKRLAE
jgi:antitoxin MazE